jgi:hypothetical protein
MCIQSREQTFSSWHELKICYCKEICIFLLFEATSFLHVPICLHYEISFVVTKNNTIGTSNPPV